MTLTEAIQNYVDLKTAFDTDEAENTNISQVLLPQAEQAITTAENTKSQAALALRQATTTVDVQAARQALTEAEQGLQDCIQLKDNLDAKLRGWGANRNVKMAGVTAAYKDMFKLKYEELFGQFDIPAAQFDVLEQLMAAKAAAEGYVFSEMPYNRPIADKYGSMEGGRVKQLKDQLLTEMIASLP
ncbi:hypothetical protein [Marinobacterium litorale]|uniref:hypothetical protein n=1 Tax=Marinobacterium litorale TaxID=404770 RepID=UPI000413D94A|nr:hypothetical protein [Marinobacterium litorale]